MKLYFDFETVEELDKQYLPGLRVPDAAAIRARWIPDSERMGKLARRAVAYGPTRDRNSALYRASRQAAG